MTRQSKLGTVGFAGCKIPVTVGILFLTCVVGFSTMGWAETQETPSAAALAQIRGLAGDWEGTFVWRGSGDAAEKLTAKYSETGHAAVVETLIMNGKPTMTSVYHLDGPSDLRMTHFCVQNQPRLKGQSH